MSAVIRFFQDNAMFYKDMTQWLRNKTFASLFFGLLFIAEALSLFIIAGSDEITNPGIAMFYTLYTALVVYAVIISFLGNGLTSREFINRTFELFELSGMSLEKMIGGKILSMLYQFFFGFFCLVPFMFFAYFLGGLDFIEMIVGIWAMAMAVLPLYLAGLLTSLTGRFRQVNVLVKLASGLLLAILCIAGLVSLFSNEPFLREIVRELTEFMKEMFGGNRDNIIVFSISMVAYVLGSLLLFYLCCNSIARETDSREIPIKVLTTLLLVSWVSLFGAGLIMTGGHRNLFSQMIIPIYLVLLGLGLVTYYSSPKVPNIVAKRYRGRNFFVRVFYWLFQPGMRGGARTLLFLIALTVASSFVLLQIGVSSSLSVASAASSGYSIYENWWNSICLLIQIPWFFTVPYVFLIRSRNLHHNYAGQRALVMGCWVTLGVLVFILTAWTYRQNSGFRLLLGAVLSPLSSLSAVQSREYEYSAFTTLVQLFTGAVGLVFMILHIRWVNRDELAAEQTKAVD